MYAHTYLCEIFWGRNGPYQVTHKSAALTLKVATFVLAVKADLRHI